MTIPTWADFRRGWRKPLLTPAGNIGSGVALQGGISLLLEVHAADQPQDRQVGASHAGKLLQGALVRQPAHMWGHLLGLGLVLKAAVCSAVPNPILGLAQGLILLVGASTLHCYAAANFHSATRDKAKWEKVFHFGFTAGMCFLIADSTATNLRMVGGERVLPAQYQALFLLLWAIWWLLCCPWLWLRSAGELPPVPMPSTFSQFPVPLTRGTSP